MPPLSAPAMQPGGPFGTPSTPKSLPDTDHWDSRAMLRDTDYVLAKLDWMRKQRIWPNGLRDLWTDALGVVLYVSLYRELGGQEWLDKAERLVADVQRVLGRPRGIRIGEAHDRDGQYFHYLAMWLFALARLGEIRPEY